MRGSVAQALGSQESFSKPVEYCHSMKQAKNVFRLLPFFSILSYVAIPVLRNARLLKAPTKTQRWPVMVFSHGLGGSKNAYSHICGSISSHGMVVIAPEHRDGSTPISFVRSMDGTSKPIDYKSLPHTPSKEVEEGRNEQLKVRLWELGLIHEAILKFDRGENVSNLAAEASQDDRKTYTQGELSMFGFNLDVHTPGAISWSGHSFGAATIYQFIKSVCYRPTESTPASYQPLYTPPPSSHITAQITPSSPVSLLDLWCLPLRTASTEWLWKQPLPCYTPGGPGGSNLVVILSEAFFKWRGNLNQTKSAISADPSAAVASALNYPPPNMFYPVSSAHLSQSDFGVLFPWLTKKFLKADEPIRTLRLNTRAILEVVRRAGIEVADTSSVDMEDETGLKLSIKGDRASIGQDRKILATDGSVRGWVALKLEDNDKKAGEGANAQSYKDTSPAQAVMENEMTTGSEREVTA